MIRKYKALGLALMALAAFGAIAAQSASAVPLTVSGIPEGGTVHLTGTTDGSSVHKLVAGGTEIKCTHADYHGHGLVGAGGAVNEVTLTPEYTNCTAFGFPADVKTNECHFTLTTPTSIKSGEVTWHPSQIHVVCTGKPIEITPTSFGASICTMSINSQTPTAGHLVARNAGTSSEMDITDEATVEGVTYTTVGGGGICPASGNNAKFTGNTTTTCFKNEPHTEPVSCTFS